LRNGDFNRATLLTLSKRAGGHCSICKKITSIPHQDPEKFHNLGEGAHICGLHDSPNLRYNPNLSREELKSARNGIWLCQSCHHIIDNDAVTYSAATLYKIKDDHDALILSLHNSGSKLMPMLDQNSNELEAIRKLIKLKEKSISVDKQLFDKEINLLKIELAKLEKERDFFKDQLIQVRSEIVDLDNEEMNQALLRGVNIDQALTILDDDKLDLSEMKLGKARLIKARLYLSQGNFPEAEKNFDKALKLWPSSYVALQFIKVLYYKKLDFDKVIEVAKKAIETEDHPNVLIELNGQLSEGYIKLGRVNDALDCLLHGLKISASVKTSENAAENTAIIIQRARLQKHAGDCYRMLGQLTSAHQYYEVSLNSYFKATMLGDTHGTTAEFAGLATSIGLLYEKNNNEVEALVHHLRAKEVIKEDTKPDNSKALIYLNIAACYLRPKNLDVTQALHHALEADKLLQELSRTNPLENLEYLIGSKTQLASLYAESDRLKARNYYDEALGLAAILSDINPILKTCAAHVLYNYAVFLVSSGLDTIRGQHYLNQCIEIIESADPPPLHYKDQLSLALSFKALMSTSREKTIEMYRKILSINEDTEESDLNILHKIRAERALRAMGVNNANDNN
jgi:tetratricopeptide (TPR) repeat protein